MKLFNVSNVIDLDFVDKFKFFTISVFSITTLFLLYYAYIIYICSNKKMKTFRIFMFSYIICCFMVELIVLLWEPYRLFPYNIIYPKGFLSPMSSTSSATCFIIMMSSFAGMVDSLITVLLERHFQIIKVINPNVPKLRFYVHSFLFLTFAIAVSGTALTFLKTSDQIAFNLLKENVESVEILLLDFQPSLLMFDHSWSFLTLYSIAAMLVYSFYRFSLALWLIYENFNYSKNSNISLSKQSKKQLNLMLQTTLAQFITLSFFGLPCFTWLFLLLGPPVPANLIPLTYYMEAMTSLYPIIDVIIVIGIVKSYRNATLKIFKIKFKFKIQIIYRQSILIAAAAAATDTKLTNNNIK